MEQVADEKNGGQLEWVRTEVDLDNHVRVPSPDLNQVESADMYVEDYVSNMSRTKISMSILSDPDALPTLPASKKQKPCSSSGGFLQRFIRLFSVLLIYWNTLVDAVMFLITILFLDDTKTPLKGPSGVGSTPRRIVHRIVSLDDVKLVKNAMNA
ncbi:O-ACYLTRANSFERASE WSD1-LIKE, partial [Salix purpurea]